MVDKSLKIPKSLHEPHFEQIFPNLQQMVPDQGEIDRTRLRQGLGQTEVGIKWLIETVQMLNRRVHKGFAEAGVGSVWYNDAGAPGAALGKSQDYYLNTTNYDIYEKQDGVWTLIGNIKGATGAKGDTGDTGEAGADAQFNCS